MATSRSQASPRRKATKNSNTAAESKNDFGRLARRIRGWTSNLVATVIVILFAVLIGRELGFSWGFYQTSTVPAAPTARPLFDDPSVPVDISFGDLPLTVRRESVFGSLTAANTRLRELSREQLGRRPLPAGTPSDSEQEFLEHLQTQSAVEESADGEKLYAFDGSLPLVVGTKQANRDAGQDGSSTSRVVIWSMAVPADGGWTLYSFYPRPRDTEAGSPSGSQVPIPPDGIPLLSIHSHEGLRMTAFWGKGEIGGWRDFFSEWFEREGWESAGWRQNEKTATARFARGRQAADVQLADEASGGLQGFLLVAMPEPNEAEEK